MAIAAPERVKLGDVIGQDGFDIPKKEKGDVVLVGDITGAPTALVRGEKGDLVVKTAFGETYAPDDSLAAIRSALDRMREIVRG